MQWGKPAPAPPGGSSSKLMTFFTRVIFYKKGQRGLGEKRRYAHTVNMDQAALDRHKIFTVLLLHDA